MQGPPDIPAAVWERVLVVMERLAGSSDLGEILSLINDSLRDCLGAERASVFRFDHAREELFASQAHGVSGEFRFPLTHGLAGEAARTRAIINTPDCYADGRFNPEMDRRTGFRTRCMLTVPLVSFGGHLEGVAQVLNKTGSQAFDALDETIARALSSQAAVALRRAALIEAERRKNKIEADLRVARDIQRATLPAALPAVDGYALAARTTPAEETGGDTYDAVLVEGRAGVAARLLLVMADATGHGIGPALSVTQLQSMVRLAAELGLPLGEMVRHINTRLSASLPIGRFVSAFIGMLDPGTGRLEYISCGQSPILVLRRGDENFEQRDADTLALGIERELEVPEPSVVGLEPGDALLLLSDGYYEQRTGSGPLGVGGVVAAARGALQKDGRRAEGVLDALARAGRGDGAPADDQTGVVLVRLMPGR